MPQKKHKPEEIVAKLRQVDVLVSQGQSVAEAARSTAALPPLHAPCTQLPNVRCAAMYSPVTERTVNGYCSEIGVRTRNDE